MPSGPQEAWQGALSRLTGMIAEHAAAATRFSTDAAGRLVASFPQSRQFSRDACARPANHSKIGEALSEACGRQVTFSLETHEGDEDRTLQIQSVATIRQRQEDVVAQPFVQRAIELFQVDATRVKYIPPRPPKQ
ncbi:MAG: hypothetical protein KDA61_05635 [Planctomycetales bacterium]|nr:hypothetical protein [Planctomycetales bacterium]